MISVTTTPLLDADNGSQPKVNRTLRQRGFICFGLFAVVAILAAILLTESPQENEKLIYVFEINRHGARAPTSIYRNDDMYGFQRSMMGQLTAIGIR